MITKKAFTMPEVLLTLGIIGVVAALSMPALLPSINSMQHKAKFQKSLNSLQNAVVANVMKDNYDFAYTTSVGTAAGDMSIYNIFSNNLDVVAVNKKGWSKNSAMFENAANYTLFFNDNFVVTFPKDEADGVGRTCTYAKPCKGVVDVNGPAKPNRVAQCDSYSGSGSTSAIRCQIKNDADIYPVKFYDDMAVPNSVAGRAVYVSNQRKR